MLNAQMWKAPAPGSFENSCSTSPILVLQNLKSYVYLFNPQVLLMTLLFFFKNVLWLGKKQKKIFFGKWSHWKDKGRQRACSSVERADITPTLSQRTLLLWFNLWVLLNNVTWIQASATMSLFLIFIIVSDLPEATSCETAGCFCSVSFSY